MAGRGESRGVMGDAVALRVDREDEGPPLRRAGSRLSWENRAVRAV